MSLLLYEKIKEIVLRYPDKPALVHGDRIHNYNQIDVESEKIEKILYKTIGTSKNVVILMDKGIELIESILGTLRSGNIFVPLDATFPENRLKMMSDIVTPSCILTQSIYLEKSISIVKTMEEKPNIILSDKVEIDGINTYGINIICLQDYKFELDKLPEIPFNKHCYIYFTSGSTGKPKAILGRQKSLSHFIEWEINEFGIDSEFKVSQFTGPSFDPFLRDVFVTLYSGATLCIPESSEIVLDPRSVLDWIETNKITLIHMVPSLFKVMVLALREHRVLENLKYILLSGELLRGNDIKDFLEVYGSKVQLVNLYGPTETTLAKMFYRISPEDAEKTVIPVGNPLPGAQIMILDEQLRSCDNGVVGEIYIRTPYITSGYLNDKNLTKQVFIKNPFTMNPQDIIYKTGDIGKVLPNGNLEILGRKDNQVKINGVRMELGEIESVILKYTYIKDVVVVTKGEPEKYLCAYFTSNQIVNVDEIEEYLDLELPMYMIPAQFIQLEKLPLNANGKIDRKALAGLQVNVNGENLNVKSRNLTEQKISNVWKEVLNLDHISIDDNFFTIGGNSIKAVQVISMLSVDFKINLNDIFKHRTIRKLGEHITLKKDNLQGVFDKVKDLMNTDPFSSSVDEVLEKEMTEYKEVCERYSNVNLETTSQYKNILITGATGYLGIYLVQQILTNTKYSIVVLVRGESHLDAENRFFDKLRYYFDEELVNKYRDRVVVINGDITDKKLGLTDELYSDISKIVDCVIHSAANVKHYGEYKDFHISNVLGTEFILDFALSGEKKDFYHISTIGIARGSVADRKEVLYTENNHDIGQKIDSVYAMSKLEAEKRVLEARNKGLNANIIRVGNLVFNSNNGRFQDNIADNRVYSLVKAFIKLKMIPDVNRKLLELSFIDYTSKAIILLLTIENLKNETYHVYNPYVSTFSELGHMFKAVVPEIDLCSSDKFYDFIKENHQDEEMRTYIDSLLVHSRAFEDADESEFKILCDKTVTILKRMGFEWTKLNIDHVDKMLKYCREVQFI